MTHNQQCHSTRKVWYKDCIKRARNWQQFRGGRCFLDSVLSVPDNRPQCTGMLFTLMDWQSTAFITLQFLTLASPANGVFHGFYFAIVFLQQNTAYSLCSANLFTYYTTRLQPFILHSVNCDGLRCTKVC